MHAVIALETKKPVDDGPDVFPGATVSKPPCPSRERFIRPAAKQRVGELIEADKDVKKVSFHAHSGITQTASCACMASASACDSSSFVTSTALLSCKTHVQDVCPVMSATRNARAMRP